MWAPHRSGLGQAGPGPGRGGGLDRSGRADRSGFWAGLGGVDGGSRAGLTRGAGGSEKATVREGQHEPDEGGDQASDDDDPLLAGRVDQLRVEAYHERSQPNPGRDDVPGDHYSFNEPQAT